MQITPGAPITLYANPAPLLVSRQAAFAGLADLGGGELVAMFSTGQAFDAADQRMVVARSRDSGVTWAAPEPMHAVDPGAPMESESFKPLRLPDGRLMATGYVFERPDALTPIVDPVTRAMLPLRNKVSWSEDGGRSWTKPQRFSVEGAPLELSGPAIATSDGRILAVAAPFTLETEGHEGWLIESRDGGENWQKVSVFFREGRGEIAPWECRLAELAPGRLAVMIWAYDTRADRNLDNRIALSQDGGASFGPAIRTGLMGQASNLMALGGDDLMTIHCHRETPVGLILRHLRLNGAGIEVLSEAPVFTAASMASSSGDIAAQFGSLKFGQPSLLRLSEDRALAAWWQVEECQHVIKAAPVSFGAG